MAALWTKLLVRAGEEKGASMVEYGLLAVLIAIVALVAVRYSGNEVSELYSEIASATDV